MTSDDAATDLLSRIFVGPLPRAVPFLKALQYDVVQEDRELPADALRGCSQRCRICCNETNKSLDLGQIHRVSKKLRGASEAYFQIWIS